MNVSKNQFGPVISIEELRTHRKESNLVLIDARGGGEALEFYLQGHLPGAIFVDLESELSQKKETAKFGGRHPLPTAEQFCGLLGKLGVTESSQIVVYDDKRGAMGAARFWWMARAIGHRSVAVLDGGYQAAVAHGEPVETGLVPRSPTSFQYSARSWSLPTATLSDVKDASFHQKSVIIDVREGYRFRGESEPIDLVAGHIPGALNIPYVENMTAEGFFLSPAELREKYSAGLSSHMLENSIIHCGSGVSACYTLLAFELAGLPMPRLYVGSWSEWSRNDLPIALGE